MDLAEDLVTKPNEREHPRHYPLRFYQLAQLEQAQHKKAPLLYQGAKHGDLAALKAWLAMLGIHIEATKRLSGSTNLRTYSNSIA